MRKLWLVNCIITKNMVIRTYFKNNRLGELLLDIREKIILNDFRDRYSNIIKKYSSQQEPKEKIDRDAPIWIFWGQGEEKMPPLVHSCYKSILRNAGTHPVHLVTMENYQNYVEIPEYIIEKLEKGIITWATFSDIMRVSLLARWGGIWLDSTIYLMKPLPEAIYEDSFFSVGHPAVYGMVRLEPSRCKWRIFLMGSTYDHIIMSWCRDLFFEYVKEFNYNVDYFMLDYFILLGCINNTKIKKIIDKVPQGPMNIYDAQNMLNVKYTDEKYAELKEASFFYKMSYRGDFRKQTEDGKDTFYKVLFSEDDQDKR